jgi:hypothetical protein
MFPVKPIVQGLWIGDRLSRFEHNSIKSYLNQGYTYHLYTYWPVANVPRGVRLRDAREIIPESEIFTFGGAITPFSDLFRYKLLYDRGGVWTDCDIICTRSFHHGSKETYIFVTERTILKGAFSSCIKKPPYTCKRRKVLNSFIMAPRGSEIMRVMYEKCLAELKRHPDRYLPYSHPYSKNYIKVAKRKTYKSFRPYSMSTRTRRTHKKSRKSKSSTISYVEGQGSSVRRVEHRIVLWSAADGGGSSQAKSLKEPITEKKNIGLQSYHWPGGSKLLETQIAQHNLDKWIRDPEFAFPVNWWDFRYIFQSVPNDRIPASRGWTEDTRLDHILEDKKTALVVIHNGWIKNQGLDKNAKYPPDSFFERLDRFVND